MRSSGDWLRQSIAGSLVLLLMVPLGEAATGKSQQAVPAQQTEGVSSTPVQPQNDLPAPNPSGDVSQPAATPGDSDAAATQTADQNQPSDTSQQTSEPPQNNTSNPVGTAAAPYTKTTGVPASRPAGAVIAPAKQKRARSILIRVSLLVGAAVAVGTVVALSKASPSRPH